MAALGGHEEPARESLAAVAASDEAGALQAFAVDPSIAYKQLPATSLDHV